MRSLPPHPFRRAARRFTEDPGSVGNAVRLVIGVTVTAVIAGSLVIWVFDRRDFPDYGTALWFALQTVTTVGYGDVTPTNVVGRVATAAVMVTAIGFVTIVTAAITSTFVEAARRRDGAAERTAETAADARLEARLDDIAARLERIERRLAAADGEDGGRAEPRT